MKSLVKIFASLTLLGIIFAGCNNEPAPVENSDNPAQPLAKVDNNGAIIYYDDLDNYYYFFDDQYSVYISVDFDAYCNGEYDYFDTLSARYLYLPENKDILRILLLMKGEDLPTYVYAADAIPCTDDPIASGFCNLVQTDNDMLVTGVNANSFGLAATGTLYDPDGNKYLLSVHFRTIIFSDDNWKSKVTINFVPTGS